MAFTALSDIYDPIEIMAIIGDKWLDESRLIASGIIDRQSIPVQGTIVYWLRENRFQDTSGQSLVAGGTISSQSRTQERKKHPVLWRYNSADEPDVIGDIEQKGVPTENVGMATEISTASTQYADDSVISVVKGTGAALTSNQTDDSSSALSLSGLVDGFAALDDRGLDLMGGAMAMRAEVYWAMVKLGVVSATTNTFGIELQTSMVLSGKLPVNVLGLTPIISNKFASLGSSDYYVYYIGQGAVNMRGQDTPLVETARATVQKKFSTITNFQIHYGLGFKDVTWGVTGKENVTDTELETAGNWTLATTDSNMVKLARVKVSLD